MYSEEIISILEKRVAWKQPISDTFTLEVDADNLEGTSGKHFNSFHKLIDVEYIAQTLNDTNLDAETLNAELADIRKQAVLTVLSSVFDSNRCYLPDFDYSNGINSRVALFDDAIGYVVAISVLQLYVSTRRSNIDERNTKMAVQNLKLELEGYRNDNGILVAKGLTWYRDNAIRNVVRVFFPQSITVEVINDFW